MTGLQLGAVLFTIWAITTPVTASSQATGSVDHTATVRPLCTTGYASAHRLLTGSTKTRIFIRDGVPPAERRGWVIDHFIPLELGGTNIDANLAAQPKAEAHRKDLDENRLHNAVCSGKMTLTAARLQMTVLWKR